MAIENSNIRTVIGVDFSGAKLAGDNIWLAKIIKYASSDRPGKLVSLDSLADLTGSSDREPALSHLVQMIGESAQQVGTPSTRHPVIWAMDFPFGLPVEIWPEKKRNTWTWQDCLNWVHQFETGAADFGRECVRLALELGGKMHIRRETDVLSRTPFDCYHYRIIHQTYWGMRSVLKPIKQNTETGVHILPFDYTSQGISPDCKAIVVEACPGSTLRRWQWPYNNYKQPTGGPLTQVRLKTRRTLFEGLRGKLEIPDRFLRVMSRNPGGDAMDAVIAATGVAEQFDRLDHAHLASHPRFKREGYVYF